MKKLQSIFALCVYILSQNIWAQSIPFGTSIDSISLNGTYEGPLLYSSKLEVYYYKPTGYNSVNSPVLWYIPGSGGATGAESANLHNIADRRNALIISPTPPLNSFITSWEGAYDHIVDTLECTANSGQAHVWLPDIFKQIYRHVLTRESRDSIPVYFTGFSAGAQCVTRYMLVRQFFPDSIPIIMAVSTDAAGYIFCTTTFTDSTMYFPFGLAKGPAGSEWDCKASIYDTLDLHFLCNEHVVQYYNENYGVLIGTADTAAYGSWPLTIEGPNRYVRAKNFFTFSDTNAITRGTTLKWIYDTVPGVGHAGNTLYNTIAAGDSIPIVERMLFKTPRHSVPHSALAIDFSSNTRVVTLPSATVQFYNNSLNALTYLWDFGDGNTSTAVNPSHTYASADTFTVKLIASSGSSCTDTLTKKYYIIVKSANGVNEFTVSGLQLTVYPNPAQSELNIFANDNKNYTASIKDIVGQTLVAKIFVSKISFDVTIWVKGMFFIEIRDEKGIRVRTEKVIIE